MPGEWAACYRQVVLQTGMCDAEGHAQTTDRYEAEMAMMMMMIYPCVRLNVLVLRYNLVYKTIIVEVADKAL